MDDSQSSDVFSDNTSAFSCNSSMVMDALDYDTLFHSTKSSLGNSVQIKKVSFPNHFTSLLEDCRLCITQSLDFVVNILSDSNIPSNKLPLYMGNAVSLLQMLSDLVKNVVETISMSCCSFTTFPTTTGQIILLVFSHCKNSESVYGVQLKNVQMQLKDLFRTCHELQLTYLMVLEKHFMFDLTETEQLDIIVEALNINLKIGEVVQSLDVKTMAEQWKAYTALCEKYSGQLVDKLIYHQSIQSLCSMVMNNVRTALEVDQDEKVIIRSLKVTNFVIKIMIKILVIFKHASLRDYSQLGEMLNFLYLHSPPYLELHEHPPLLINGMRTNVCLPTDMLLAELIKDENFNNVVLECDENKDEKLLGYILLIVSIEKIVVEKNDEMQNFPKIKLLNSVFRCVSDGNVWLNMGLKFKNESNCKDSYGFYEHILIHTTALALTVDHEDFKLLERILYESMFIPDSVNILFGTNLWITLAKLCTNRQLLLNQMIFLCKSYQKLNKENQFFTHSLQKRHFDHVLHSLFDCMLPEDKIRLSRKFSPLDINNMSLWSVLTINNLPRNVQRNVQDEVLERYKHHSMSNLDTKESVYDLIQIMKLAASCSFSGVDDDVEDCIVQAWLRACPKACTFLSKTLNTATLWYYDYVEALTLLTRSVDRIFNDNIANLVKVMHIISNIIKIGNTELSLVLMDLLCELALQPINDENKQSAEKLANECFRTILVQDSSTVKSKLIRIINYSHNNKRLEQIMSSVIADDPVLQEFWDDFRFRKDFDRAKLKEQLLTVGELKYVHRCIEAPPDIEENSETIDEIRKTCSTNFDFADLDTLFDNESDSEQPVIKKLKLDGGEAQAVLNRLENDVSLLCTMKENSFTSEHRRRIKDLCVKLKSIVD